MMIKIGDKVKFLNEPISGVVIGFVNAEMAKVAIEDGFEIPVRVRELISLEADEKKEPEKSDASQEKLAASKIINARDEQIKMVAVATDSIPHKKFDIFLVNASNCLLHGLYSNSANSLPLDFSIKAGAYQFLSSLEKEEMGENCNIYLQALLIDKLGGKIYKPVEMHLPLAYKTISQFNLYKTESSSGLKGMVFSIMDLNKLPKVPLGNDHTSLQEEKISGRWLKNQHTIEIDLHIEALLEDFSAMDPQQIINYQLSECKRSIEWGMNNGAKKLIVIHGVGNGVLREKVRAVLKQYPDLSYSEASILKYGSGATEVLFN